MATPPAELNGPPRAVRHCSISRPTASCAQNHCSRIASMSTTPISKPSGKAAPELHIVPNQMRSLVMVEPPLQSLLLRGFRLASAVIQWPVIIFATCLKRPDLQYFPRELDLAIRRTHPAHETLCTQQLWTAPGRWGSWIALACWSRGSRQTLPQLR